LARATLIVAMLVMLAAGVPPACRVARAALCGASL
jgi:hypothetical protein